MLPLNPSQIPGLFKQAMQLQSARRYDEAEAKYRQILGVRPNLAEVHFQLGRMALERGNPAAATSHFERAAKLKPQEPAIWQNYAQAVAALDDPARSKAFLKSAKAARIAPQLLVKLQDQLSPAKARSKTAIGDARPEEIRALIALMNRGDFGRAEAAAATLRARHPKVAIIADILANAQARLGKAEAAEESFRAAVELDPNYAEAHNNYGRFLVERDRSDEGIAQIRAALKIAPKMALAYQNLGVAHARRGDAAPAIAALETALKLQPGLIEAQGQLGEMYAKKRDFDAAVAAFQAVQKLGNGRGETAISLAQALSSAGRESEALELLDKVLAASPDLPRALGAKATTLQSLGRFDEAEALLRRAIELEPENGENYRVFFAAHKVQPGEPLIAQMKRWFDDPSLSDDSRMNMGFALAKALEDTKAYDQVFTYLNPANALMRKKMPYDINQRRDELAALREAFRDTDFNARRIEGASDFAPIFVTGMPRSGTTLVEQILASHSRVTGAGEVGRFVEDAVKVMTGPGGTFRPVSELEDAEIAGIGKRSEAWFREHFPEADLVTDKSIQSYVMAGLIRLALPRARIIVVRRDPRDIALSIYKNVFPEGTHRYGYDLRDLGLYYRMFEEMIAFWREKLPGGFHEVQYEELIAAPEEQARALVAAAGLDWEDQCLNFHQTKRKVQTLSVYQVRQPIYTSSMKAWQRYEKDLAPLIEALGDVVEEGQ